MTNEEFLAVDRVICEAFNFQSIEHNDKCVPLFILDAKWSCGTDHVVRKWNGVVSQTHSTCHAIMLLYCALDSLNKKIMIESMLSHRESGYVD